MDRQTNRAERMILGRLTGIKTDWRAGRQADPENLGRQMSRQAKRLIGRHTDALSGRQPE